MTAISQVWRKYGKIVAADADERVDIESEKELVESAKTSAVAFGRLYEIHYGAILNYLYRRTLNVNAAEELTSNTFFNALNALPRFRRQAPFRAWLYRIALNELRMHFRREKRRRNIEDTFCLKENLERIHFSGPFTEDREGSIRQYAFLHREIAKLPKRYQDAIVFRFIENLSYSDISQILGKRMGTVKSLIHRGLKRLRHQIEKNDATFFDDRHSF